MEVYVLDFMIASIYNADANKNELGMKRKTSFPKSKEEHLMKLVKKLAV